MTLASRPTTDLVVAWSHESIVTQVSTDISRYDFSVDTILGNKILIRASRGLCSSVSFSIAFSLALSVSSWVASRHDECYGKKRVVGRKRDESSKKEEGMQVTHTTSAEQERR